MDVPISLNTLGSNCYKIEPVRKRTGTRAMIWGTPILDSEYAVESLTYKAPGTIRAVSVERRAPSVRAAPLCQRFAIGPHMLPCKCEEGCHDRLER
ncbi:hypothetical protein J6590_020523 [Homalodisca vitripennis]|nr:hypothetical protein J6590_020523 [Homalodisca vitripennis]